MLLSNKLETAQKSFKQWKEIPFSEKQKFLSKLADLLEKNTIKFGKNITREMNKPIS
ncbi:MAG: aldehyde dehydrogenase family protein, partial [Kaistella sp.]